MAIASHFSRRVAPVKVRSAAAMDSDEAGRSHGPALSVELGLLAGPCAGHGPGRGIVTRLKLTVASKPRP